MNRIHPQVEVLLAAILLTAGCAQEQRLPISDAGGTYVYACANDYHFTVLVRDDSVEVDLGHLTVTLPNVPAASGARFSDGRFTFWSKGEDAVLETPGGSFDDCQGEQARDPWDAARLRGAVFRGVGQEPGWTLEIIPETWIAYLGDYGRTRVFMPVSSPILGHGTTTYRSSTEAHDLEVIIRDTVCTDVMSGERFEKTVELQIDGNELHGCGRLLDS